MKTILVAAVFYLSSFSGACIAELKSAIGFGVQYGGTIGWQGSILNDRHRGSVGVGFYGASVGYDYKLSKKLSAGASAFAIVPTTILQTEGTGLLGNALRMSYYPKETFVNGRVFGVDILRASKIGLSSGPYKIKLFFSIGYDFK